MTAVSLKFGGTRYPVVPDTETLLQQCDPWTEITLRFFQTVLRLYLGDACKAAFGQDAVRETTHLDPQRWLVHRAWPFPLLALSPLGGTESESTLTRTRVSTRYRLAWVLPQLSAEQARHAEPLLLAARKLLSAVTYRQHDVRFDGGATPWIESGVSSVSLGTWEVVDYQIGEATGQLVSALQVEITLTEELGWEESADEALDQSNLQIDLLDDPDLEAFVEAQSPDPSA